MNEVIELVRCNKAISVNPFNGLEYKKRGTLKADNGNYTEAIEDYNKAIELYPKDAMCFFNRGTVKVNLGDVEGAKEDFRMAALLDRSEIDENKITFR